MDPNYDDGEFLLTDKVSYRFGLPERGDVVVFKAPPDDQEEFIKRIIGLPGDTVMVRAQHVYINGKQIDETQYLASSVPTDPGAALQEGKEITVPAGHYLVMGDNRPHSFDGRNFGVIAKDKITGKAWISYWPPNKAGSIDKKVYTFKQ